MLFEVVLSNGLEVAQDLMDLVVLVDLGIETRDGAVAQLKFAKYAFCIEYSKLVNRPEMFAGILAVAALLGFQPGASAFVPPNG